MEASENVMSPSNGSAIWSQQAVLCRLRQGEDDWRTVRQGLVVAVLGCACFGAALGVYGLDGRQILASAVKVPLLLLGTTALCFPTFYVLQAIREAKPLSISGAAAIQALALAVTGLVWGGFSAPLLFLVSSTSHYKLAQVLALGVGSLGGVAGLLRFLGAYQASCTVEGQRRRGSVLAPYLVLFAAVGGQLAWVLRPFIGDPGQRFELFRNLGGNMFTHILGLLGG